MSRFITGITAVTLFILGVALTAIAVLRTDISPTVLTEKPEYEITQSDSNDFEKGDILKGSFIASYDYLGIVLIPLQNTGKVYTGKTLFKIRESNNPEWYFTGTFDSELVSGLDYYLYGFLPIPASKNKTYIFEIHAIEGAGVKTVSFEHASDQIYVKYQYPRKALIENPVTLSSFLYHKTVQTFSQYDISLQTLANFLPFLGFLLFISFKRPVLYVYNKFQANFLSQHLFSSSILVKELLTSIILNSVAGSIIYRTFLQQEKLFIQHYTDFFLNLWPNYVYISSQLKQFEFPIWNFSVGLGTNVFAGNFMRVSLIDPFTWLTFMTSTENVLLLIPYILVLKITVAGSLFYLYLRSYKVTHLTALTFGLAYAISGQMIVRSPWYHYTTEMVFLPLLLISLDQFVTKNRKWPIILCFAWVGNYHVYHVFLFGIFTSFYVLWKLLLQNSIQSFTKATSMRRVITLYLRLFYSWILGLLLASPLFFPNVFNYLHSARWVSQDIEQLDTFYQVNSLFVDLDLFLLIILKFFDNGMYEFHTYGTL